MDTSRQYKDDAKANLMGQKIGWLKLSHTDSEESEPTTTKAVSCVTQNPLLPRLYLVSHFPSEKLHASLRNMQ